MQRLTADEVDDQIPPGWALLVDGLHTRIAVDDFAAGVTLVNRIGAAASQQRHYPDLTLRVDAVDVRLTTPEVHGVTDQDVRLAAAVTALATEAGLTLSTRGTSRLELGLDTADLRAIAAFWGAVMGVGHLADADVADEVRDPSDALPTIWFQPSGSEEPRQHWHPDVWVDPAEVPDRIAAALAAGGTLISDAEAPAYWILADPEGNRVCLCTSQSRD